MKEGQRVDLFGDYHRNRRKLLRLLILLVLIPAFVLALIYLSQQKAFVEYIQPERKREIYRCEIVGKRISDMINMKSYTQPEFESLFGQLYCWDNPDYEGRPGCKERFINGDKTGLDIKMCNTNGILVSATATADVSSKLRKSGMTSLGYENINNVLWVTSRVCVIVWLFSILLIMTRRHYFWISVTLLASAAILFYVSNALLLSYPYDLIERGVRALISSRMFWPNVGLVLTFIVLVIFLLLLRPIQVVRQRTKRSLLDSLRDVVVDQYPVLYYICIDNTGYESSLVLRKVYRVVRDPKAAPCGQIRVVDESGCENIYPSASFAAIRVSNQVRDAIIKSSS